MRDSILIDVGKHQKISAIHKDGEDIPAFNRGKESHTLIIMAHDFPGHKAGNNDLYADLEFLFAKKGHHTLRFDFRGCGDSYGKQEHFTLASACEDFQAVRHWAKTQGYKKFVYVGEGLGATVSFMNVDQDVNVVIVLWPVLSLGDYGSTVFSTEGVQASALENGYIERDGDKISTHLINEMATTDIIYSLKEISAPTMVFHGVQDKKIPIGQLDIVREHIQARRIEITSFQDGAEGLQKLNHRKAIFYQAQQFVEKYA